MKCLDVLHAGGIGDLLLVRLDHAGAQTVIAGASAYELLGPAEESLLFSQVEPQLTGDTGLRTLEVPIDEEPETLATLPAGHSFLRGVLDPDATHVLPCLAPYDRSNPCARSSVASSSSPAPPR